MSKKIFRAGDVVRLQSLCLHDSAHGYNIGDRLVVLEADSTSPWCVKYDLFDIDMLSFDNSACQSHLEIRAFSTDRLAYESYSNTRLQSADRIYGIYESALRANIDKVRIQCEPILNDIADRLLDWANTGDKYATFVEYDIDREGLDNSAEEGIIDILREYGYTVSMSHVTPTTLSIRIGARTSASIRKTLAESQRQEGGQ